MREEDVRSGEGRRLVVADRLQGKVGKEEANYRASDEEKSKESCFECVHFLSPGNEISACRRVAGVVYATDICDLYATRPTEGQPNDEF